MLNFIKKFKYFNNQIIVKIFLFTFFISGLASAQIPDKFENLKVLPKDIGKRELIEKMKSFSFGLGVRCTFCHVAENPKDLKTFDFPSDEKTHKQKARIMIEMVNHINKDHLSKLSEYSDNVMKVNCMTCHHGQNKPKLLQDVLFSVIDKKGIEAGVTKYKKLKEKFYGSFTFDFQVNTLADLTQELIKVKKLDEALVISKLNLENYPDSFVSTYFLGVANEAKGNKKEALEAFNKTLKFSPNNPRLKKKIESLKNKK